MTMADPTVDIRTKQYYDNYVPGIDLGNEPAQTEREHIVAQNSIYVAQVSRNIHQMVLAQNSILMVILAVSCIAAIASLWRAVKG